MGSLIGVAAWSLAMLATPSRVDWPRDFSLALLLRICPSFLICLGIWAAWLRRSWWWALANTLVGLGLGMGLAWAFRQCLHTFAVWLLPIAAIVLMGTWVACRIPPSAKRVLVRASKCLLAGLVIIYPFQALYGCLLFFNYFGCWPLVDEWIHAQWWAGTIALGIACFPGFMLLRWAIAPTRRVVAALEADEEARITVSPEPVEGVMRVRCVGVFPPGSEGNPTGQALDEAMTAWLDIHPEAGVAVVEIDLREVTYRGGDYLLAACMRTVDRCGCRLRFLVHGGNARAVRSLVDLSGLAENRCQVVTLDP